MNKKEFNIYCPVTFLEQKKIDCTDIVLLGFIRWYCQQSDVYICTAKNQTLARKLGIEEQAVKRHLKNLEKNGLITRETKRQPNGTWLRKMRPTEKVKRIGKDKNVVEKKKARKIWGF